MDRTWVLSKSHKRFYSESQQKGRINPNNLAYSSLVHLFPTYVPINAHPTNSSELKSNCAHWHDSVIIISEILTQP